MNTKDIINIAITLPVEERAMILDSILQSMNQPIPEIEQRWGELAQKRLMDLKTGKVKPVPGKQVFQDIWNRFEK